MPEPIFALGVVVFLSIATLNISKRLSPAEIGGEVAMADILLIALSVALFAIAGAYSRGCGRL